MKLAFSTNAYLRFPVVESIRRIAAIGYRGVEVAADVPHAWPAGLGDDTKHAIRAVIQELGLSISNINAFMMNAVADARQPYWYPSWIEPDCHYRQVRIDHTMRAITLARELGAPSISTEPGGPVEPGQSWSAALTLFVEMLKPVVAHAEREGVSLLIEPEPGLLLETADQYEEFARHFDSPAIGLNFDVGHFYCSGENPEMTLRRLRNHIRHIHLEDIAASRVHAHLIPGDGAIDFAAVFRAIGQIGFDGWVTIELYPFAEDPDHAARLARDRVGKIAAGLL